MITLERIAIKANVSVSTVSKALSNHKAISQKTKDRIRQIADELGYTPNANAQSLVNKRANTIGVVYEVEFGLRNLFFTAVLEEFRKNAQLNGYDILFLSYNNEKNLDYLRHCQSKNVDGVLIVSIGNAPVKAIKKLTESNMAVITLDPLQADYNTIYSNSYQGIQSGCKHLYELGHRKIAFINGSYTNLIGQERLKGYLDFMNEHGLKPIYNGTISNESYTFSEGYQTMKSLLVEYGLPDAIVCSSDLMAMGASTLLQKRGYKVPQDVSVIGFDNISVCEIATPRLTTIAQNYELIGKKAWDLMICMLNHSNERKKEPIIVDTELVIRESTIKRTK